MDLIETWGFREAIKHVKDIKEVKDIKDVKDIMNIVNNNNKKDKTWSPRAEILSYVNLVSQLLDLIETWGFREDIKHVKDIK